ncbi:MAG: hypothetical protein J4G01_03800 [Dehalococcoidia bacterium]|nr:hypothetical protein [Dehalococcoidia bacterium]
MIRPKVLLPLLMVGVMLLAQPVYAHGFGERYDLPVPLGYYVVGAGLAVALSFVVLGFFVRGGAGPSGYPRYNLLKHRTSRAILTSPLLIVPIKLASVCLLGLLIFAGFFGDSDPSDNLAPTFIWIIWWVGMGFFVALVGNLWALVNPWAAIYEGVEWLYRRFSTDGSLSLNERYPEGWRMWPAAVTFFCFAWVENVYSENDLPARISLMVVAYSLLTLGGMVYFGKHTWLRNCEGFSVVFGFLSRFSPLEVRAAPPEVCADCDDTCLDQDGRCIDCYQCFEASATEAWVEEEEAGDGGSSTARQDGPQRELNIRPYAVSLARPERVDSSMLAVVILLLATVTFDGFSATSAWGHVQSFAADVSPGLNNPILNSATIANSIGLLLFPFVFYAVYVGFAHLMARMVRNTLSPSALARVFVYSLIPIALAYNIAHFLPLLLVAGQRIIPLASDPFGWGWDLFGTVMYNINIGVLGARTVWFLSVAVIVVGHIVAVYLAHRIAMRTFGDRRLAIASQYPMLLLMVLYTMVSLWIIGQPIVE